MEDRRFVTKFFALGEDRIDETIRRLVDLALRERPEFAVSPRAN
jgi:hypothetical protein